MMRIERRGRSAIEGLACVTLGGLVYVALHALGVL
jgi:hypothetical protein